MIELISKSKKNLSNNEFNSICLLKDEYWKYGLKKQKIWFKKNVKSNDLCNILVFKKKIIGFTLLRKRSLIYLRKKYKYLLFDTLIIKKQFRKRKFSYLLMIFNNLVIKKENKLSFLICDKNLVNFYKKYNWKKIKRNSFKLLDHHFSTNALTYNFEKKLNKGNKILYFYTKS
tara:strand:- start:3718 stop:4236 length:519 start_codon:yes stop_codon:yes gene_type:complete